MDWSIITWRAGANSHHLSTKNYFINKKTKKQNLENPVIGAFALRAAGRG
jgi:hypothetical protein